MPKSQGNVSLLIIALLAVVAVASLSAAGYFYWKTQQNPGQALGPYTPPQTQNPTLPPAIDETANWKTYANTQYGFSFKYPEGGSLEGRTIKFADGSITITINSAGFGIECFKVQKTKTITIDGQTGTMVTHGAIKSDLCGNGTDNLIWINFKDSAQNRFDISYTYKNINAQKSEKILDQILATFKFMDKSNSNLKTFKSNDLGFSIEVAQNEVITQSDQNPDFKFVKIPRLNLVISNSYPQIGDPIFRKAIKIQDVTLPSGTIIQLVLAQRGNSPFEKDGFSTTDEISVAKNAAFTSKFYVDAKIPHAESEADFEDIAQILKTFKEI